MSSEWLSNMVVVVVLMLTVGEEGTALDGAVSELRLAAYRC